MLNEVIKLIGGDFDNVNYAPPFGCYTKATIENFERLKEICKQTDLDDKNFNSYLQDGYKYLFLTQQGTLWMNNTFTGSFSGLTGGYGCFNEVEFKNNEWVKIK